MMLNLVRNETLKVIRRRRFTIVIAILIAILALAVSSCFGYLLIKICNVAFDSENFPSFRCVCARKR